MKIFYTLLAALVFMACAKTGGKKPADENAVVLDTAIVAETTAPEQHTYVSSKFKTKSPFDELDYDRVTAYDYEGASKGEGRLIIGADGKLAPSVSQHKDLTQEQVVQLTKLLGDNKTYGDGTASCFDPHMGLVFYKKDKVVCHISICLDCNYLRSSIDIPATRHALMYADTPDERALEGFSKTGQKKISALCSALGFSHCK